MAGIKNFVLGFILSLFSVTFLGQLYPPSYSQTIPSKTSGIHITLFKKYDSSSRTPLNNNIFANIKKQSLTLETTLENSIDISSNEGIEDDEILSIALDNDIPIEFSTSFDDNKTEVLTEDSEEKSAMLPSELQEDETFENTPWVVAKGSPYIKNKRLLSELEQKNSNTLFTETITAIKNEQNDLSYKVAEKIKQSIIFPIPNEILNDENLTPTFIHTKKNLSPSKEKGTNPKDTTHNQESEPKVVKKESSKEISETSATKSSEDTGILDSISAWFTNKPDTSQVSPSVTQAVVEKPKSLTKKKAPSYSSQDKIESIQQQEELASFYESLQQTRNEHIKRNIASLELKLFFQPGRAEISGKTLDWLKTFSEAALKHNSHLQIRLDGSVDTELQKKRLNLLYTIFMNNGVDFKKIDTVFSLTEPNAFIIRTLRTK